MQVTFVVRSPWRPFSFSGWTRKRVHGLVRAVNLSTKDWITPLCSCTAVFRSLHALVISAASFQATNQDLVMIAQNLAGPVADLVSFHALRGSCSLVIAANEHGKDESRY